MFGIAAEARQHGGDLLLHARDLLACRGEPIARLIEIGLRGDLAGEQLLLAVEFALLVVERVLRRGQLGLTLAVGRAQALDLETRAGELRLRLLLGGAIGALIEPEQHLAGFHLLIVADIDADDAAGDVGADRRRVSA